MPRIIAEGKKLTKVSAAGEAAALAAVGGPVDAHVQRKFALDPSELNNDAALEAISASQQAPVQPVVQVSGPIVGAVGGAHVGQDVVVQSALLVELNDKLDKLIKKRGLDTEEDEDDTESEAEEGDEKKVKKAKLTHSSKKQKKAEELTQELSPVAAGDALTTNAASDLIAKVNSKLDTLLNDETDSEVDSDQETLTSASEEEEEDE